MSLSWLRQEFSWQQGNTIIWILHHALLILSDQIFQRNALILNHKNNILYYYCHFITSKADSNIFILPWEPRALLFKAGEVWSLMSQGARFSWIHTSLHELRLKFPWKTTRIRKNRKTNSQGLHQIIKTITLLEKY